MSENTTRRRRPGGPHGMMRGEKAKDFSGSLKKLILYMKKYRLRFAVMLYLWKAFDIVCLDWLLLTKSHFFQRYYPETEGGAGYHSFGFNRKEQLIRLAVFPFAAALMALIAMWIGGQL